MEEARPRARRRWLAPAGLVGALLGLIVVAPACGVYRAFVYPAPDAPPPALGPPFEALEARTHDGAIAHAYLVLPPDERAHVVVVLHGNGETMENRAGLALDLRAHGLGAALVEYRGYGRSRDQPSPDEDGLYQDAAAILEALAARGIGPDRVVLLGISLGTGVAAQMAACGASRSLVLVSPFTSMTAEAHHVVPWLPVGWLVPDRFDTRSKAPSISLPVLVVHGDEDEVVPFAMGKEVACALPRATFMAVPGGHHNDLFRAHGEAVEAAIVAFAKR